MNAKRLILMLMAGIPALSAWGDGWLENPISFPEVQAEDLNKKMRSFPEEFERPVNLVFVAFERRHQEDINTWLPVAEILEEESRYFAFFEFPVIRTMGPLRQGFINGGMRVALRDFLVRARTITLYLEKDRFRSALEIPTEDTIRLFLVTNDGLVRWRLSGPRTEEREIELRTAVDQLLTR